MPFEVPESWAWTRFGGICYDFQYRTSEKSEKGSAIMLRMVNFQNGEIDYVDLVYTTNETDISKYLLMKDNLF